VQLLLPLEMESLSPNFPEETYKWSIYNIYVCICFISILFSYKPCQDLKHLSKTSWFDFFQAFGSTFAHGFAPVWIIIHALISNYPLALKIRLTCTTVRVLTTFATIFHCLLCIFIPWRNNSCSALVHLPADGLNFV
jgi:hypothetical protein